MADAGASKVKRFGKVLLDYAPALAGLIQGLSSDTKVLYATVWAGAALGLLSLGADYFHCKQRWANGQPAVWPKMIALVFLVLYSCMVLLLYSNVLSVQWVQVWGGCFTSGGFFLASAASLFVGKPFVYANAVEWLPPERLEEIASSDRARAIFDAVMRAVTMLWSAIFGVLTLVSIASALIRESGKKDIATIVSVAVPIVLVVITFKHLMPKVIERTKQKYQDQLTVDGADAAA